MTDEQKSKQKNYQKNYRKEYKKTWQMNKSKNIENLKQKIYKITDEQKQKYRQAKKHIG